jgi:hypothetical protein
MNETPAGVYDLYKQLSAAGVPGMMFVFILMLYRGTIVWGRQFQEERSEKLEWKSMYFRKDNQTDRAITVAEKIKEVQ